MGRAKDKTSTFKREVKFSLAGRCELALELEPLIRERAKERQREGGREKVVQNSSQPIDERKSRQELAKLANVSHDTLSKARLIKERADDETKTALRRGETSIHAASNAVKNNIHFSSLSIDRFCCPERA